MSKPSREIFLKLSKSNTTFLEIPTDYTVSKFYEFGYKVSHNKSNDTYNCCCPICREGKSWGRKKRCFFVPENDLIFCHNCGWSSKPYKWIREVSGMSHDDLKRDIEEGEYGIIDVLDLNEEAKILKEQPSLPLDSINLSDDRQVEFYKKNKMVQIACAYIKKRRLDTAINKPDAFYISLKDKTHKNRLIIPFKDQNGKIIFYQSRKLLKSDEKCSYISKFDGDKSLFGIERINPDLDYVFLIEGPIDACFLQNSLGLGGINKGNHMFTPIQKKQIDGLSFFKKIWVLDSQWLDTTAREKTNNLIEAGETVFIWPREEGLKYKDLNQMCIDQQIDQVPIDFIIKNSSKDLPATVRMKLISEFS